MLKKIINKNNLRKLFIIQNLYLINLEKVMIKIIRGVVQDKYNNNYQ